MTIGAACLAYIITVARPIQRALSHRRVPGLLAELLACALCVGFWVGLVATGSVWEASVVAVMAETLSRLMKWFNPL
jgi:hypothetical protein